MGNQTTGPPTATSRTIGYYPMDEASGDFVNAIYPETYLRRNDPGVTQQVEANGLALARTQDGAGGTAIIGNSADGIMLAGREPWCLHGFFRWRNIYNTNVALRAGAVAPAHSVGPWQAGADFKWQSNVGIVRLSANNDAGTEINLDETGVPVDNRLFYVAVGFDGANLFIKHSSDGSTWTTESVAHAPAMEIIAHTILVSYQAALDLGQICITRDIPTEADLTWFANGMAGRSTLEVTDRLGTWPELQQLPATVQTDGGTTWSGTTLQTLTGFATVDSDAFTAGSDPAGLYWLRPYHLRSMDAALADTHGDYVWLASSDHESAGISIGFSDSPSIPPTSWERIWAANVSGEPGATNADISGFHAQSETPWLVYNPDDAEPFWLYYHDEGRSIAQDDGSTGYTSPQETRLITSASLTRGTWAYRKTVMPVRNYGSNQILNHRGYAVVQRNGTGDWEAWHLQSDRSDHTYSRSISADGLTWTLDWFQTDTWYRRWSQQIYCPPGWRMGSLQDVFVFNGQRYALGHMDMAKNHSSAWPSFRDPDQRYVCIAPLGSDGFLSGPPIILYEANGPYYDAGHGNYDDPSWVEPHDGYIQSTKGYLDGSTLHLYIKHRFKTPSYIVHATVDLSSLAA